MNTDVTKGSADSGSEGSEFNVRGRTIAALIIRGRRVIVYIGRRRLSKSSESAFHQCLGFVSEASRAGVHLLGLAVSHDGHPLDVGEPTSFRVSVRVTHIISRLSRF